MSQYDYDSLDDSSLLKKILDDDKNALDEWEKRARDKGINADETLKKIRELYVSNPPQKGMDLYLHARTLIHTTIDKEEKKEIEAERERQARNTVIFIEVNRLYDEAIELSNPHAMIRRALMYKEGLGCEQNLATAKELYEKASNLEKKNAEEVLGRNYEKRKDKIKKDLDSVQEKLQAKIKEDLKKYQDEFYVLLGDLEEIKDSLKKKTLTKKKYIPVAYSVSELFITLQKEMGNFFSNPSAIQWESCKKKCYEEIAKAEKESAQHREGWYAVHPIIRGILGILATITLLPALFIFAKSEHGYVYTFFKTPKTKISEEIEEKVQQNFDELCSGLSSSIELTTLKEEKEAEVKQSSNGVSM